MTGGDDDYGDAFKQAKLEHDQRRQGSAEKQRLQAEVDADAAALSNVVLPQLQAAAQKLEPLGGKVEIRQYGRTGKTLRPASVVFRITDQQDQSAMERATKAAPIRLSRAREWSPSRADTVSTRQASLTNPRT